jgi:hypothetical protein
VAVCCTADRLLGSGACAAAAAAATAANAAADAAAGGEVLTLKLAENMCSTLLGQAFHTLPPLLLLLLPCCDSVLRHDAVAAAAAVAGGEALTPKLAEDICATLPGLHAGGLFNSYGPTEVTVTVCAFEVSAVQGLAFLLGAKMVPLLQCHAYVGCAVRLSMQAAHSG